MSKYKQIFNDYLEKITTGELKAGEKLPTEKEIGILYEVSRITTIKAMSDLEGKGLIFRVAGKGTFVTPPYTNVGPKFFHILIPSFGDRFYDETSNAFDKYFTDRSILSACLVSGYESPRIRQTLEWIKATGTSGVAVMASQLPERRTALVKLLEEFHLPAVNGLRFLENFTGYQIVIDDMEASDIAVSYLAKFGHRKIAFVGPSSNVGISSNIRYVGFARSLGKNGLCPDECPVIEKVDSISANEIRKIFTGKDSPTAIVAADGKYAIGIYDVLRSIGVAIPGQVAIITLYGGNIAPATETPLTSVEWPGMEFGKALAEALLNLSEGKPPWKGENRVRRLSPLLKVRESCGTSPGKYRHEYLRGLLEENYG